MESRNLSTGKMAGVQYGLCPIQNYMGTGLITEQKSLELCLSKYSCTVKCGRFDASEGANRAH